MNPPTNICISVRPLSSSYTVRIHLRSVAPAPAPSAAAAESADTEPGECATTLLWGLKWPGPFAVAC